MERITLFVDILLPLPIPGTFTYRVPYELNGVIKRGQRVTVQFGARKIYAGLVERIHQTPPNKGVPKYILGIIDEAPVVNEYQFRFWRWIADYYMSYPGDVMNAAMPGAFKLMSESKVVLNQAFQPDASLLSVPEYLITEALLHKQKLTIQEITKIVGFKKVLPVIKNLIEKQAIVMEEELKKSYTPKKEKYVRLNEQYTDEEALQELMDGLGKRAHKQLELLMTFLTMTGFPVSGEKEIAKKKLLEKSGASAHSFKSLEEKGVFVVEERIVSRFQKTGEVSRPESIELSPNQQEAFQSIRSLFEQHRVVLLHGVTSSGKTELYIKWIAETLRQGKQVLYLLPEIALTTQIIGRLQKYFGDEVGVYHSRYNPYERAEVWYNLLGKTTSQDQVPYKIILGPRSAMFLPFDNLGLIIVDEEHDNSYKQYDPAPRYHARDAAIYLSTLHDAHVLLGSATPSIESYFNAQNGKYGLVTLNERYGGIQMPEIIVVNMKDQVRRRLLKSHFSSVLLEYINKALAQNLQVILFQNRRGFSLRLECEQCGWVPQCKYCDVTLTYHKRSELLKCHYCGYSEKVPAVCHECGSPNISLKGFGTEKVEEELSILLPHARIDRMDLDSTRSKNAFQRIFADFESGKTNVLTGTQMVTKGLDFDHVAVVGILSADSMLSFPDFRAHENSFQMMEQVSGRAGRKNKRGTVIIQTWKPEHPIIRQVLRHDYGGMYQAQLVERKRYLYPPFYRLIILKLKHADYDKLNKAADVLARAMRASFGKRVYGPEYPMVARIKNMFIKQIMLKIPRQAALHSEKQKLKEILLHFQTLKGYKSVRIQVDVDPQ